MADLEPSVRFLAIHLGASNSKGTKNETQIELAKQICRTVMEESTATVGGISSTKTQAFNCKNTTLPSDRGTFIGTHLTAEDAVVRAVELMENAPSLNCGLGSNLNMLGQVECDASLMSGRNHVWTGVGSVSGCKNPIKLVKNLHDHATITRPLGLIQPNFLVASGARQWMREHCRELLLPESHLISSRALSKYQSLKSNYDKSSSCKQSTVGSSEPMNQIKMEQLAVERTIGGVVKGGLDTVGAIAVDHENNFACAISSGGIMLKHKGRIGQAGFPGAGCWSQDSMAVTTTGVGEYLTASLFAKKFHEKVQKLKLIHDLTCGGDGGGCGGCGGANNERVSTRTSKLDLELMLSSALNECFLDLADSPALMHVPLSERSAGLIAVSSFPLAKTAPLLPEERHHEGAACAASDRRIQVDRSGANDGGRRGRTVGDGEPTPPADLYLSYGHNTRSLCIGYIRAGDTEAVSFVSCSSSEGDGISCSSSSLDGILVKTLKVDHCSRAEK